MRLFNTLGRQLEEFKPIKDGEVSLYTCGPTVYDYTQLGNLRSFVFDDTLRRVLCLAGFQVKHVMNITDVGHLSSDMDEGEDKLEKGAEREGQDVWRVAERYIKAFKSDMDELNVLPPNGYRSPHGPYARATDFIEQQIELVKLLTDKGFAYQTEQAIYFDVSKLDDYGKLSGQKLDQKEVGARAEVVSDPAKRNPQDFALWFFRVGRFANHSMHWPSPWGDGFPGWHLECSAIIHTTLGDPIDIHTGGVDHIGTHHTNEIAQTEAAYGHSLANYWLHNEFLLVDGARMGKSLGNFYTLKDTKDKGYEPLALRLLFLQAHYRSQMNFTWESLAAAQARLKNWLAFAALRYQASDPSDSAEDSWPAVKDKLLNSLTSDLDTPKALMLIDEVMAEVQSRRLAGVQRQFINDFLTFIDDALGLRLMDEPDITQEQKNVISEREAARTGQDWTKSDKLRDNLTAQGIGLNDTEDGPVWYRL